MSGCASLRTNDRDLVCGGRDACVVCEGQLVQAGVSRPVALTTCEGVQATAAAAAAP